MKHGQLEQAFRRVGVRDTWHCPTCAKQLHRTRDIARAHLLALTKSPRVKRVEELNIYPCPAQDGFHVGRQPGGADE